MKKKILLLVILALAAFFRFYGLNWDQGYHLHPDERAIVMFTTPLELPNTIKEFFSVESAWNPHFFAYGSFPIYLLKVVSSIAATIDPLYTTYDKINLIGRLLSAIFDIGTLLVLFFLAKKLFNKTTALMASFFYAVSVLPIQLSHFYAVDTPLTFFTLMTLWWLIRLYEKPILGYALFVSIFFGLALATKISAIVLLVSLGTALSADFFLIFLKQLHRPHIWFPHLPKFLKKLLIDGIVIIIITFITFIIFEPYALIDFKTFWLHNMQQRQMTNDAFTFPYTLQYVGKIPYWYELKNIFLWGLGPVLATLAFLGSLYVSFLFFKPAPRRSHFVTPPRWPNGLLGGGIREKQTIILLVFFWAYFFVVGNFAIGFMRYMLPLYPLLCLFAAVFFIRIRDNFNSQLLSFIFHLSSFILLLAWPIAFVHIYTQPNTRVLASEWINQNIPAGKTLAIEHWDDGMPLFGQQNYQMITLALYDPETREKWLRINEQLAKTDYIIIASNRLSVPLQKLTDCTKYKMCYQETEEYYKKLFDGSLGFQKVVEFSTFPNFSFFIFHFSFDDSSADESFTVYDHPKVMVFKRER